MKKEAHELGSPEGKLWVPAAVSGRGGLAGIPLARSIRQQTDAGPFNFYHLLYSLHFHPCPASSYVKISRNHGAGLVFILGQRTPSSDENIFPVAGGSLAKPAESRLAAAQPSRPGTRPSLATASESRQTALARGIWPPGWVPVKKPHLSLSRAELARGSAWAPRWHRAACPSTPARTRDKQPCLVPERLPSPVAVKPWQTPQGVQFQPGGWGEPRQREPSVTKLIHSAGNQRRGIQGFRLTPEPSGRSRQGSGPSTEQERTSPGFLSAAEPRERPSAFHPGVLTAVPSLLG